MRSSHRTLALATAASAQTAMALRDETAKALPVLETVSPELQALIVQILRAGWNRPLTTPEAWRHLVSNLEASIGPQVAPMRVAGGLAMAMAHDVTPLVQVV